jgi:hypothetical protein
LEVKMDVVLSSTFEHAVCARGDGVRWPAMRITHGFARLRGDGVLRCPTEASAPLIPSDRVTTTLRRLGKGKKAESLDAIC